MSSVLVTGANGFVGSALLERLNADGPVVTGTVRRQAASPSDLVTVGELGPETDWNGVLPGHQVVVHTAARVHVMQDSAIDPLAEFRRVNVEGTLSLARQAAAAGVKRFIFISSIKVNGEGTPLGLSLSHISAVQHRKLLKTQVLTGKSSLLAEGNNTCKTMAYKDVTKRQPLGRVYTPEDAPQPADAYGVSKKEAEDGLRQVATDTGMEVVIIRPPLVYGPGVRANFLSMMRWLNRGIPLPLGAIKNTRSLVALDNLVDLIITCIDHPAAADQTFLVSDGEDLSTTELLRRMGAALSKPARLLPVPPALLSAGATVLGKRAVAQRLLGSLQVDISKTQELLGWAPPVRVDDALRKTAEHFLADQG